jgi:predicted nucleotidyltransferase component of viral defense system
MIPQALITEWSQQVPWKFDEQVEQDLVISRALVDLFKDEWIATSLAFRGGTSLHKLWLAPAIRYSEDIDLVQVRAEPIKETINKIQQSLTFLGDPSIEPRKDGIRLRFRYESEFQPSQFVRLKVETNTREHFTILGHVAIPFSISSSWFSGGCSICTFMPEELLGTKLRALYQRRKGRDLFDLYIAFILKPDLNRDALIHCYKEYMNFSVTFPPSRKQFIQNMDEKLIDPEFLGDTKALLRPGFKYNPEEAYELVRKELIEKL